ncbi:MAG: oxidoreductase, partial [Elusimicrobiota bacterium]
LQLLEVLRAALQGARPSVRSHSVCIDCKRRGTPCVLVTQGHPCLGPLTHAGCGAICPAYGRACYGCFGPSEDPNTASAVSLYRGLGRTPEQVRELFRGFTAWAEPFRKVHAGAR